MSLGQYNRQNDVAARLGFSQFRPKRRRHCWWTLRKWPESSPKPTNLHLLTSGKVRESPSEVFCLFSLLPPLCPSISIDELWHKPLRKTHLSLVKHFPVNKLEEPRKKHHHVFFLRPDKPKLKTPTTEESQILYLKPQNTAEQRNNRSPTTPPQPSPPEIDIDLSFCTGNSLSIIWSLQILLQIAQMSYRTRTISPLFLYVEALIELPGADHHP